MIKYRYPREGGGYNETLNLEDVPPGVTYEIIEFDPNPPVDPEPIIPNYRTIKGVITFEFDGIKSVFEIPHGLYQKPLHIDLTFSDGSNTDFIQSERSTNEDFITINCNNPPSDSALPMTIWWSATIL